MKIQAIGLLSEGYTQQEAADAVGVSLRTLTLYLEDLRIAYNVGSTRALLRILRKEIRA